MQLATCRCN